MSDTGVLDPNSSYAYVLLADRFGDTCIVAEDGEGIAGFVTGFRDPRDETVAFLWQVGVAPSRQGEGLGRRLLDGFITLPAFERCTHLETTISPDNAASEALFRGFAARHEAEVVVADGYSGETLGGGHEDERLFRIGPLKRR